MREKKNPDVYYTYRSFNCVTIEGLMFNLYKLHTESLLGFTAVHLEDNHIR